MAVKENRIERNPFQYLKELKEPPRPDVYLTFQEINKILEASQGHYFHSLFLVSINTGMRRGELAGLCWDKVNFQTSLMEICRLRDRNGLGDRTKTVKSRRFIPMNAVVKHHLQKLRIDSQSDYVFVDEDGQPFDVDHLYRDLRRFLELTQIEKQFRFHDLRHTFASHFMMNGGNIYDLQKILGHTSLEMTQRYAHLAPEHLVQASNVVSFGAHLKSSANIAPRSLSVV
jgi:integrase